MWGCDSFCTLFRLLGIPRESRRLVLSKSGLHILTPVAFGSAAAAPFLAGVLAGCPTDFRMRMTHHSLLKSIRVCDLKIEEEECAVFLGGGDPALWDGV